MDEHVPCQQCLALILPATAKRHNGLCKPCHKRNVYDKMGQTEYGKAYEIAFKTPRLKTDEFFSMWIMLELALAGPLYEIRVTGHCDYLFHHPGRIPGVRDVASFKRWCLSKLADARAKVQSVRIATGNAQRDREAWLKKVDEMEQAVLLACKILEERQ